MKTEKKKATTKKSQPKVEVKKHTPSEKKVEKTEVKKPIKVLNKTQYIEEFVKPMYIKEGFMTQEQILAGVASCYEALADVLYEIYEDGSVQTAIP
jgi:hypothetical protein